MYVARVRCGFYGYGWAGLSGVPVKIGVEGRLGYEGNGGSGFWGSLLWLWGIYINSVIDCGLKDVSIS